MADPELDRYKEILSDITKLMGGMTEFRQGRTDSIDGMSYAEAVKKMSRLRALQLSTKKDVKKRYADEKG